MPRLDALAGPLAMIAAAALVPQITGRLLRAVLRVGGPRAGPERVGHLHVAFGIVDATQMIIAWMAGSRALGPELVASSDGPPNMAFGVALAAIAWGSLHVARPRPWPTRDAAGGPVGAGALLGIAVAAGLFGLWGTLDQVTTVPRDEVTTVAPGRARLRLLLSPWDPDATLGFAWATLRSGHADRARELLRDAERVGADREATLRLQTAVESVAGDCAAARAAFEAWLAEHAARAFEEDRLLHQSLSLESFRPPAAYLERCGAPPSEEGDGGDVRTSPDASR